MAFTLQDYLTSLKGKRVAVIGIGVSNTPLIKTLLSAGISVTKTNGRPLALWRMNWNPWGQSFIWAIPTWKVWIKM